jgi:hypothetical protein
VVTGLYKKQKPLHWDRITKTQCNLCTLARRGLFKQNSVPATTLSVSLHRRRRKRNRLRIVLEDAKCDRRSSHQPYRIYHKPNTKILYRLRLWSFQENVTTSCSLSCYSIFLLSTSVLCCTVDFFFYSFNLFSTSMTRLSGVSSDTCCYLPHHSCIGLTRTYALLKWWLGEEGRGVVKLWVIKHTSQIVRSRVLTATTMKTVFWDTAPCSIVEIDRRLRGAYCHPHQECSAKWRRVLGLSLKYNDVTEVRRPTASIISVIALIMESVRTSETSL